MSRDWDGMEPRVAYGGPFDGEWMNIPYLCQLAVFWNPVTQQHRRRIVVPIRSGYAMPKAVRTNPHYIGCYSRVTYKAGMSHSCTRDREAIEWRSRDAQRPYEPENDRGLWGDVPPGMVIGVDLAREETFSKGLRWDDPEWDVPGSDEDPEDKPWLSR